MPSAHADPAKTADAVRSVKAGHVDVAALTEAIRGLARAGKAAVAWEVDCSQIPALADAGVVDIIGPGQLTLGEQITILDKTGVPWHAFDPSYSQVLAAAFLATVLSSRSDHDYDKAHRIVEQIDTDTFDNAHRLVESRPADPTSPGDET